MTNTPIVVHSVDELRYLLSLKGSVPFSIGPGEYERVDFRGQRLQGGSWRQAVFRYCDFTQSCLDGVVIEECVFEHCLMTGLHVQSSSMSDVKWRWSDCQDMWLQNSLFTAMVWASSELMGVAAEECEFVQVEWPSEWQACWFSKCTFRSNTWQPDAIWRELFFDHCLMNAVLLRGVVEDSHWDGGRIEGLNVELAMLRSVSFSGVNLEHSRWHQVQARLLMVEECEMDSSHWQECDLSAANLVRVQASHSIWKKTVLKDAQLSHANLHNAQLWECDVSRMCVRGAQLSSVLWRFCNQSDMAQVDTTRLTAELWSAANGQWGDGA